MIASDVIKAVATEAQPPPSGKAQLRLLAWLVADARGAAVLLDKADAAVAGKRLEYQAQRVRQSLTLATETAEEQRAILAEQAAETTPAEVEQARAEIDREEQQIYNFHQGEVYVGFHELEDILPRAEPLAVGQPRYPELVEHQTLPQRPLPSMPPDLAAALDTAVCEEMRARFASTSAWAYNDDPEEHVWWTQLLPDFVAELVPSVIRRVLSVIRCVLQHVLRVMQSLGSVMPQSRSEMPQSRSEMPQSRSEMPQTRREMPHSRRAMLRWMTP